MAGLPTEPIFVADGRPYGPADVLAGADLRGDLGPAIEAARAARAGGAGDEDAVRAAVRRWRVERGLLAAEDAERWLAARGLAAADVTAFAGGAAAAGDAARAAFADLALAGGLDRLALEAARRAAVHAAWVARGRRDPAEAEVRAAISAAAAPAAPALEGLAAADREHLRLEEALYRRVARGALGPKRLAAALERARLDLHRLDLVCAAFATHDAAEEAALCVRLDGETLADLAPRAATRAIERSLLAEDLPLEARLPVLAAAARDLAGPVALGAAYHVFEVRSKVPPALDDPEVVRRLEERILEEAFRAEVAARIRWTAWTPNP